MTDQQLDTIDRCVCVLDSKKTIGKGIFTNKGEEMVQRKVYLGAGCRILSEKKNNL